MHVFRSYKIQDILCQKLQGSAKDALVIEDNPADIFETHGTALVQ